MAKKKKAKRPVTAKYACVADAEDPSRCPDLEGTLRCDACGQPLTKSGGYEDTGLCGPCATGESETASEFGETY